jgi:hypothetical protein
VIIFTIEILKIHLIVAQILGVLHAILRKAKKMPQD